MKKPKKELRQKHSELMKRRWAERKAEESRIKEVQDKQPPDLLAELGRMVYGK